MKKSKSAKTAAQLLEKERRQVAALERKEPLRRRLLVALKSGPATSGDLTKVVGATQAAVSRKLTELREAGLLVCDKGTADRRENIYRLTPAGRSELGRHLAFGRTGKVPSPPDIEEREKFMREALSEAVALRREENRLQDAIDRLEEIQRKADRIGASNVALEALAELAKTQRQNRKRKPLVRSLESLQRIALGEAESAALIFPAIAHLEYERGKSRELAEEDFAAPARHLTAAVSLFEQLGEHGPKKDVRSWQTWQAWSLLSLAGNLRRQSAYEESLRHAASALRMFDALEDAYGQSQCWFLFGFNLRLLKRFEEALSCLNRAHVIAADPENSFLRARANCLMQMGDVRRCQGRGEEAKSLLGEAAGLAESLNLMVTEAFAVSAIGAVEFQERDFEQAQATLESAQVLFNGCGHREGVALNARRQATVARRLSEQGVKPNDKKVKDLIRLSEGIYWAMGSPAGVAACEVERGWMRMYSPSCGKVETIVKRLSGMLTGDSRQWESLVHDTWVPRVLRDFANGSEDKDLAREAQKLYKIANRELQVKAAQGVESISAVAGAFEATHESRPSALASEMGGESSRKEPPEALPPAPFSDSASPELRSLTANR